MPVGSAAADVALIQKRISWASRRALRDAATPDMIGQGCSSRTESRVLDEGRLQRMQFLAFARPSIVVTWRLRASRRASGRKGRASIEQDGAGSAGSLVAGLLVPSDRAFRAGRRAAIAGIDFQLSSLAVDDQSHAHRFSASGLFMRLDWLPDRARTWDCGLRACALDYLITSA